jgi:hypothetical protein
MEKCISKNGQFCFLNKNFTDRASPRHKERVGPTIFATDRPSLNSREKAGYSREMAKNPSFLPYQLDILIKSHFLNILDSKTNKKFTFREPKNEHRGQRPSVDEECSEWCIRGP